MDHVPVLLQEVIDGFKDSPTSKSSYYDGTFGRGGHFAEVLKEFNPELCIGSDGDLAAIEFGRELFKERIASGQVHLIQGSYTQFEELKEENELLRAPFDLMLLDLGVSSPQLDQGDRGFSFYHEGPLDMRMDQRQSQTAAGIINDWHADDLIRLFQDYGEIRRPYRVVRAIVNDRETKPFETTKQLSSMIERIEGWRKKGSHPATRFFLALRMAVNNELKGLEEGLPQLMKSLSDGGRLAIISFHSLEDRIVKNIFRDGLGLGFAVNKKVIKPSQGEEKKNTRSRSSKLRIFQRGEKQ